MLTFGDKPAPAMAQTALKKTADENRDSYPEAASSLQKNSYMDDIRQTVCRSKLKLYVFNTTTGHETKLTN